MVSIAPLTAFGVRSHLLPEEDCRDDEFRLDYNYDNALVEQCWLARRICVVVVARENERERA